MKRSELVDICKKYNISTTGTKQVLEQKIKKAKFFENHVSTPKIVLHHLKDQEYVHVTKDLVVDKKTNLVIGKLDNVSNTVVPLHKKDIELCKSLRIDYKMPIVLKGEIQTHRVKTELEEDESEEEL